jgi:hypothetical protein
MPDNYYCWSVARLRSLLIELKTGGVGMKDMPYILQIENLIWEKENV